MTERLPSSAQKVQEALTSLGLPCQVVELPASTRTAQEAASSAVAEKRNNKKAA